MTFTLALTDSQLREVIRVAVPFTSREELLPILCHVRIHTVRGLLVADATDRYKAIRCHLGEYKGGEVDVFVHRDMLITSRRLAGRARVPLAIETTDTEVATTIASAGAGGSIVTLRRPVYDPDGWPAGLEHLYRLAGSTPESSDPVAAFTVVSRLPADLYFDQPTLRLAGGHAIWWADTWVAVCMPAQPRLTRAPEWAREEHTAGDATVVEVA